MANIQGKAQCIYCKRSNVVFNREHVIPEAFGKFGAETWVLHDVVCAECNQYFANQLELRFARGSQEAVQRLRHGVKKAVEGGGLITSKVELVVPYGEFKGARLEFCPTSSDGPAVTFPAQVGLTTKDKYERDYVLLGKLKKLDPDGFRRYDTKSGHSILIISGNREEEKEILAVLREKGVKFNKQENICFPFKAAKKVEVMAVTQIDQYVKRAVAKILFNEGTRENCVNLRFINYPEFQTSTQTSV